MSLKLRNEAEARQAWIGWGTEENPDSDLSWEDFLAQKAPHIAEAVAVERVTAAFGTVIEQQGENLIVANGFGGTTTVAASGTRRTDAKGQQKAAAHAAGEEMATDKQKDYVRKLLGERIGNPEAEAVRNDLNARRSNLTKPFVSSCIDRLLKITKNGAAASAQAPEQPRKGNTRGVNRYAGDCDLCGQRVGEGEGERDLGDDGKWHVFHVGGCPTSFPFPEGRYAVPNSDGELRFYHLTRGLVFVQASDNEHRVESKAAVDAIVAKIAEDVAEASRAYGRELGSCGVCNRTLTNTESRAAGIGPICAAKMGW